MALTVTAPTTTTNIGSIGFFIGSELTVTVDSDIDLTGSNIYVNPGMFVQLGSVSPVYDEPLSEGYALAFPATTGVHTMNLLNFTDNFFWANTKISLNKVTNFQFTLQFESLYTSDLDSLFSDVVLRFDNKARFLKNRRGNPFDLNNGGQSVYNSDKALRLVIVHEAGFDIHSSVTDIPYNARFWGKGLNNADPEHKNFGFVLKRDDLLVDNFSIFEDTEVDFHFETTVTPASHFYVGIFREDASLNNTFYWDDINLHYAQFSTSAPTMVFSFPHTAMLNAATIVNTAGNQYKGTVTFDKDYFEYGGQYRVFIVTQRDAAAPNNYTNSNISAQITANAQPNPTYGTVTSQIMTYDNDNSIFTQACLNQLAPRERVKVCVTMDEASYNTAVFTNNISGTYDDNFIGLGVRVVDTMPLNGENPQLLGTSFNSHLTLHSDETGGCVSFRVPDEWAGTTKILVFFWRFIHGTQPNFFTDIISYPVRLHVNAMNSGGFTLTSMEDGSANIYAESETICDTYTGNLTITAAKPSGMLYNMLAILQVENSQTLKEYDPYLNSNFPQLVESDAFVSVDDLYDLGTDEGEVVIDMSKLEIGKQYKLTIVSKRHNFTYTPPSCDPLDINIDIEITAASNSQVQGDFNFDIITAFPVGVTIASVVVKLGVNNIGTFTTATGTASFTSPLPPSGVFTGCFGFLISLSDGCFYVSDGCHFLETVAVVGATDSAAIRILPV